MKCSRCDLDATIKQGNQWLCDKHYRFGQMRVLAKRRGKLVPSHDLLESLAFHGMGCPDCGVTMNWRAKDGQATVASLQHYRDGSLGIVCRSCNTRHAFMDGDTYRDLPSNFKFCPGCKQEKPATEFSVDNGRSGPLKRKSKCKSCSNAAVKKWKEENREQYNEYQRNWRTKIKNGSD